MANFFSKLFQRKESESRVIIAQMSQGRPVMTPRQYDKLSDEAYVKNVVGYASINKVATAMKTIPIGLFKKPTTKKGRLIEIESHPILDLLRRPNPLQSGASYLEAFAGYSLLSGNFYAHTSPLEGQPPKELWPLRPDRVTIIPGRTGLPAAYEYKTGISSVKYEVNQITGESPILHFRLFHPTNDWYGLGAVEPAAFSVDQHNQAGLWNVSLLQNSAKASGVLTIDGKLDPEQGEYIKRKFMGDHSGPQNAGKPLILEKNEVTWTPMSFSPDQMSWVEGKNDAARSVALGFGVPPQLLGIPGDNTFSNYQEARLALYIETVLPFLDSILEEHSTWLSPRFGEENLFLHYDKDEIDALSVQRKTVWDKVVGSDFLTTNEKRVACGYEERKEPEADEILIPSGKIPLTFTDESVEPAPLADENSGDNQDDTQDDNQDDEKMQVKVFVRNRKDRRRIWKQNNRKRIGFEKRMARDVARELRRQGKAVSKAVDDIDSENIDVITAAAVKAIHDNEKGLAQAVESNMTRIGKAFGRNVLDSFKDEGFQYETKQGEIRFESFLFEWVKLNVGRRIKLMQGTTARKVREGVKSAIETGLAEGEGIPPIGKRIEKIYSGFTPARSKLIARTETVSASNASQQAAARAANVPNLQKEWISSNDERSRRLSSGDSTEHRGMDGVRVGVDETFSVDSKDGIDEMNGPGDPDAPVDQIANCRCTLGFVKEGDR